MSLPTYRVMVILLLFYKNNKFSGLRISDFVPKWVKEEVEVSASAQGNFGAVLLANWMKHNESMRILKLVLLSSNLSAAQLQICSTFQVERLLSEEYCPGAKHQGWNKVWNDGGRGYCYSRGFKKQERFPFGDPGVSTNYQ